MTLKSVWKAAGLIITRTVADCLSYISWLFNKNMVQNHININAIDAHNIAVLLTASSMNRNPYLQVNPFAQYPRKRGKCKVAPTFLRPSFFSRR